MEAALATVLPDKTHYILIQIYLKITASNHDKLELIIITSIARVW